MSNQIEQLRNQQLEPPRPALSLVPKDRGTEQFPYGKQALGKRPDLPFTVGR